MAVWTRRHISAAYGRGAPVRTSDRSAQQAGATSSEQSIVAKMKQMKLTKSGATLTMVEAAGSLPVAPRGSSSEAGFVMVASEKKVVSSCSDLYAGPAGA